jgi:hypothetical protein
VVANSALVVEMMLEEMTCEIHSWRFGDGFLDLVEGDFDCPQSHLMWALRLA